MHLIDKIQNWTQNGPTGNHKQFVLAAGIGLSALGAAAKGYGAWRAGRDLDTQPITPGDIRGHLSQSQSVVGQMQGQFGKMQALGRGLMDPTSAANQQQYGMMQQQGSNQMALQALLNRRQQAAMGGGGSSGIAAAQQRGQQSQMAQNLSQQFQNQMTQNRAQGIGVMGQSSSLLGNIGKMQMGIDENVGQAAVAQRQWQLQEEMRKRQAQKEMWGAVGTGISGIGSGIMGTNQFGTALGEWGAGGDDK